MFPLSGILLIIGIAARPSGEWARIALIPAFLLGLPAALFALVIALAVRREVPVNLRRVAIPLSMAALLSPFLVSILAR